MQNPTKYLYVQFYVVTKMLSILLYVSAFSCLIVLGLLAYIKLNIGWNKSYKCLKGKTAIITGSNTGIGFATALDIAMRGARVILACRNHEKAELARKRIIDATGNENIHVKLLDMSSLQSVRDFCKNINETENRLDILVNNAGAGGYRNTITKDGLQLTWQVNYFSPFLLTFLLIGKLKKSTPSRVVNLASYLALYGTVTPETINEYPKKSVLFDAIYSCTKQANILFTVELSEKLSKTGVTTYAVHPGAVRTEIFRRMRGLTKTILTSISNVFFKTPEEGAQTTIHCALSDDLKDVSGKLYAECREIEIYENCADKELAKILWEKSEELVKLTSEEKKILNEII